MMLLNLSGVQFEFICKQRRDFICQVREPPSVSVAIEMGRVLQTGPVVVWVFCCCLFCCCCCLGILLLFVRLFSNCCYCFDNYLTLRKVILKVTVYIDQRKGQIILLTVVNEDSDIVIIITTTTTAITTTTMIVIVIINKLQKRLQ